MAVELVGFALSPVCNQVRLTLCPTEPELNTVTEAGQDVGLISDTKLVDFWVFQIHCRLMLQDTQFHELQQLTDHQVLSLKLIQNCI